MPKSNLHIDVLGTDITISADETPEYLDTILDKYRDAIDHVQRITGPKDPLKIAILTGFLLCDELEKAGKQKPGLGSNEEAEQLTLGMISRLEDIICPSGPDAENGNRE